MARISWIQLRYARKIASEFSTRAVPKTAPASFSINEARLNWPIFGARPAPVLWIRRLSLCRAAAIKSGCSWHTQDRRKCEWVRQHARRHRFLTETTEEIGQYRRTHTPCLEIVALGAVLALRQRSQSQRQWQPEPETTISNTDRLDLKHIYRQLCGSVNINRTKRQHMWRKEVNDALPICAIWQNST